MSKITVITNEYEFSHGKKPRGTGNWIFQIGSDRELFYGIYSHARKAAIEYARKMGYRVICLCS